MNKEFYICTIKFLGATFYAESYKCKEDARQKAIDKLNARFGVPLPQELDGIQYDEQIVKVPIMQ